jgi:subtilisin family serine protease
LDIVRHTRIALTLAMAATLMFSALAASAYAPSIISGAPTAGSKAHPAKLVEAALDNVYIVRLAENPAVAYTGGIQGYAATAPGKGAKLDSADTRVKRYVAYLTNRHDQLLASIGAGSGSKIYSYTYSLNGFAAVLTHSQATKLAGAAGVASVEPDRLHQKTTENSPSFLGLDDPSNGLWTAGYDGEGVIVGIIDTGIWPEHPSFSDQADLADRPGNSGKRTRVYDSPPASWRGTCQSGELWSQDDCNNKLIGARYFLGGFEKHGIIKDDYKSARDADGHGSHTASTAAGNAGVEASIFGIDRGTVSGMAPRARIAVYKGLWNDQGGYTSDLAAAIDAAVADGVDVINYSIGSDSPAYVSADAFAFLFANRGGVFSAVSAGNAGPDAGSVGAPAAAPWVMTVGASTQDRTFQGSVAVGGSTYFGASVTGGTGSLSIVDAAAAGDELCRVGALDPSVVAGKIVLCKRGDNARVDKSRAVAVAGGAGMVLFNAADPQSIVTDNHWVPSVHISFADGDAIRTYIAAHPTATAVISGGVSMLAQGSVMADFSSRGPNEAENNLLKPDVTAPGVNILAGNTPTPFSGAPGELFQSISGTSMSSPHVAGLAALLVQAHPTWTPDQIKSALMLTARQDVVKEDGTTPADAFDFGAGHVVPNSAVDPGITMTPADTLRNSLFKYIGFTCVNWEFLWAPGTCAFVGGPVNPTDLNLPSIAISQLVGSETVSRTFTSVDTGSVTWTPSVQGLTGIDVTLPAPVTLPAGEVESWDVTFTRDDAALDEWAQGGIVWTAGDGSGRTVRLPVVLKPAQLAFPSTVTTTVADASGLVEWDVKSGYDGILWADGYGLAADAALIGEFVAQDPDQDVSTDTFTSGVKVYDFAVGATTRYVAMGTLDATTTPGSDLDVYLFFDANSNATFGLNEIVAFSADGDSTELVELVNPAAGNYRLVVHGWGTPGGSGSTYDLHRWTVNQAAADSGTLVATAGTTDGSAVAVNDTIGIDAAVSGLTTAGQYRGLVNYRDAGGSIGTTVLIINR